MASKKSNSTKKSNKKLSSKKKKMLRGLVYTVFVIFILSVLFLIGYGIYYMRTNGRFSISKITVNECEKYTAEEIIGVSELTVGENIFKISKADAISKIEQLPYVENCEIEKRLPNEIKIVVTERVGKYVAYAKDSGQYVRLDKAGVILEVIDVANMEEETLMFGLNFDDVIELGQSLTGLELTKVNSYEKIKGIYDQNEIDAKITSVEFKDALIILTLNDKLDVILKDNKELEYNIAFLKTILNELEGQVGTLDMTQDNPTYSAI